MKRKTRRAFRQYNAERNRAQKNHQEQKGGFVCSHCKQWVVINQFIGTSNRNHCPLCLWSKHVDEYKPGDRKALCLGGMKPVAVTLRMEGTDRSGEIMLVHECAQCQKISINRIAADDSERQIISVFYNSFELSKTYKAQLKQSDIYCAEPCDEQLITVRLYGDGGVINRFV